MKKKIILLMLIIGTVCMASANDLSISIDGRPFYNILRISSLDINQPQNQPLFFTVTVTNTSNREIETPYLHFTLKWENDLLFTTKSQYKSNIQPGMVFTATNRELFLKTGQHTFSAPNPPISVSDIIESIPYIRDTILRTGLFPDGRYIFTAQFKDQNQNPLSNEQGFPFTVRNPSGLFPISPGTALGGRVPNISGIPVSFRWSSNLAGTRNTFHLKVVEFEDPSLLTADFVEVGGNIIFEQETNNTFFSDFIPLRVGRYYAWQVSTEMMEPEASSSQLKSQYYVFRYVDDTEDSQDQIIRNINYLLLNLNIPSLIDLLNAGFTPTGNIEVNGRVLTEDEIEAALQRLISQTIINITVSE